jgi:hypothetical protein
MDGLSFVNLGKNRKCGNEEMGESLEHRGKNDRPSEAVVLRVSGKRRGDVSPRRKAGLRIKG